MLPIIMTVASVLLLAVTAKVHLAIRNIRQPRDNTLSKLHLLLVVGLQLLLLLLDLGSSLMTRILRLV